MKLLPVCLLLAGLLSLQSGCKKDRTTGSCFKGKLAVKGMCGNYTIQVLQGNIDTSKIEAQWRDDATGTTWNNVFGLGSVCTFPQNLREGEEFWFTIDKSNNPGGCAVCLAYYPTPSKKLWITVLPAACNP